MRPIRSRISSPLGRVLAVAAATALVAAAAFLVRTVVTSRRHAVPIGVAATGVLEEAALALIRGLVSVYDPVRPTLARLGPTAPEGGHPAAYIRIEEAFALDGATPGALRGVRLVDARNEQIIRGKTVFRYQPADEPRLQELRRKYRLDEVMSAPTEFERMVQLRHWVRTRFRRADYQPFMRNFDALEVLDRDYRDHGEPYLPERHFDPCHFFPLLYVQVLASVGHQARLVSTNHGMTEIWSNQFRKWVLMDAELDQHVEKDGVPLNMVELSRESPTHPAPALRVVPSPRAPGEENPTVPHLGVEELSVGRVIGMFQGPLEITELRNDWMTNTYFRGHPARSESSSLVYARTPKPEPGFWRRLRPHSNDLADFYWTLNQTEILVHPGAGLTLSLGLRTYTPNWDRFEIAIDGGPPQAVREAAYDWPLHPGTNSLTVQALNALDVRGPVSAVTLSLGQK